MNPTYQNDLKSLKASNLYLNLKLIEIDTRRLDWEPAEDITAYELAACLPILLGYGQALRQYDALPSGVKRHFRISQKGEQ